MAAIYQWFENKSLTIYTTTLYPIETIEGVAFGAQLITGGLWVWPGDLMNYSTSVISGTLQVVLQEAPTQEDSMSMAYTLTYGMLKEVLQIVPTQEDFMNYSTSVRSGTLTSVLIRALAPDDGVEFGCTLIAGELVTP